MREWVSSAGAGELAAIVLAFLLAATAVSVAIGFLLERAMKGGYALLPALASQLVVPISAEAWAAYIAFNVFGNMVGHSNVELVPRTPVTYYSVLFSNAFVFHSLHHARWTGHYSFQSALMDRLFGTEWKDWPALHQEVAAGQALKSLRETREG